MRSSDAPRRPAPTHPAALARPLSTRQLDASAHDDGIDWGILGDGPVAAPSQGQAKSDHTEK